MTKDLTETVLLVGGRLKDSAEPGSVADEHFDVSSPDEADIRIEEAVTSLARATFQRGWRLAFRYDPVAAPLVVEVALQYWQPLPAEERFGETRRFRDQPIVLFGEIAEDAHHLIQPVVQMGCARILPERYPTDLTISKIICIGGTEDVISDIDWLRNQESIAPIFTIPSTGGAAKDLSRQNGVADLEERIVGTVKSKESQIRFVPPENVINAGRDQEPSFPTISEPERAPDFRYALYPLLMDAMLDSDSKITQHAS